jgi:hypothetical protein
MIGWFANCAETAKSLDREYKKSCSMEIIDEVPFISGTRVYVSSVNLSYKVS